MTEYFISFINLFFSEQNQLITMFASGFLSATVLPGNSEIIFTTLAIKHIMSEGSLYSTSIASLVGVATISNSLGSMVTYAMGRLLPRPQNLRNRYSQWAFAKSEKYGVWVLLLSWLPIVGDIFCAVAGWLRFNVWQSVLLIMLGKLFRYLFLLATLYPIFQYAL